MHRLLSALKQANDARAPGPGCIHHSDRGSVYASHAYALALTELEATKSMSRKGDCYDNSVAESFFATIKRELIDPLEYPTRRSAIESIGDYIDSFYNPCRRHSSNDYTSPIEREMKFFSARDEGVRA